MKQPKYSYILKSIKADMTAHGGFKYPKKGIVKCEKWEPTKECGNGLHGALNGEGDGSLFCWDKDAKWLILKVLTKDVIDLQGKVKVQQGIVVFCGERIKATEKMKVLTGSNLIIGGQSTSGYEGQSTSGDWGQSTSGDDGQSTSGYEGQSTSGDDGQSTSGYEGQSTSGDDGQSTSGYSGQSTSGDEGQSTSGDDGQSTSGDKGQSTGRWSKKLEAGKFGACLNFGNNCHWICTPETILVLHWADDEEEHLKSKVFYAENYAEYYGQMAIIEDGEIKSWQKVEKQDD
jgi:hypothetical protein